MTTKMVPKHRNDNLQTVHNPATGKDYTRGDDGAFDIDDGDVEDVKSQHGLVEKNQQQK